MVFNVDNYIVNINENINNVSMDLNKIRLGIDKLTYTDAVELYNIFVILYDAVLDLRGFNVDVNVVNDINITINSYYNLFNKFVNSLT
jgi:hypothetical protein